MVLILERILWSSIEYVLKHALPALKSVFEDGRNRLLLTSRVVHYLLFTLILATGSSWLDTGTPEYDHTSSPEHTTGRR